MKITLSEKAIEAMTKRWKDKRVKIVGESNPWTGQTGTVLSVDHTKVGWGLKVDLDNGFQTYVYKPKDIEKL